MTLEGTAHSVEAVAERGLAITTINNGLQEMNLDEACYLLGILVLVISMPHGTPECQPL